MLSSYVTLLAQKTYLAFPFGGKKKKENVNETITPKFL